MNYSFFKQLFFFIIIVFTIIIIGKNKCSAEVVIQSRVDKGSWQKVNAIYPLKSQNYELKVARITNARIKWYSITPDISELYKNANFPWDKNPYKWNGYAKINYYRKELLQYRGKWKIKPTAITSPSLSNEYNMSVGSFWIQAEIAVNGKVESSPGINKNDYRGMSPEIFRISIRECKGYLGYLTSFFNVPGLFGSVQYQSYNYIGVDCADVLIAAYGRWKNKPVKKNYNVAMLVDTYKRIHEFDIVNGNPTKKIHWSKDVLPGDFIAVRYSGGRQFIHIGALYCDDNKNGVLDKNDRVLHAGPSPLHYSKLNDGGFNGHVVILRLSMDS